MARLPLSHSRAIHQAKSDAGPARLNRGRGADDAMQASRGVCSGGPGPPRIPHGSPGVVDLSCSVGKSGVRVVGRKRVRVRRDGITCAVTKITMLNIQDCHQSQQMDGVPRGIYLCRSTVLSCLPGSWGTMGASGWRDWALPKMATPDRHCRAEKACQAGGKGGVRMWDAGVGPEQGCTWKAARH